MSKKRKLSTPEQLDKLKISKEEMAERIAEEAKLDEFEKIQTKAPHWLSYKAKTEYKRIIPLLETLPIASLDLTMVANYCELYSHYRDLDLDLNKNGKILVTHDEEGNETSRKLNPAFNAYVKIASELRAVANTLGLTVDSRLKMIIVSDEELEDPLTKFLKGG